MLVTGGAGFIGSHPVELLVREGARVTVVDDLSGGSPANLSAVEDRVELVRLSLGRDDVGPLLRDRPVDLIFHLAATVDIPASVEDPRRDLQDNLLATFELLEAVRAASPSPAVIGTSSAAVYGGGSDTILREDAPTVPIAPYGVSKLAAERYLAIYPRLYGVRTATLRLFPVYGPRLRRQVVYDLIRKVHENPEELFIYGDGTQVRDFNHAANVAEAFLAVAERGRLEGEAYNVAAETPVTIEALARMICKRMGAQPRFVYSGEVRPGESQRWSADVSRMAALGYAPRLGLAEGLTETVSWFRSDLSRAGA